MLENQEVYWRILWKTCVVLNVEMLSKDKFNAKIWRLFKYLRIQEVGTKVSSICNNTSRASFDPHGKG